MTKPSGLWEIVAIENASSFFESEYGQYWLVTLRRVGGTHPAKKSQFIVAKDKLAVLRWAQENYNLNTPLAWCLTS